jgi:hypothetical protein
MHLSRKRSLIGAAVTLIVLGIVGFVYAAWIKSDNGSGYARATSAQAVTFGNVSFTTPDDLYPGANKPAKVNVTNHNPYPIVVTDVVQQSGQDITADNGHSTCGSDQDHPTGVTFTDQEDLSGAAYELAASGSAGDSKTISLSSAVHMSNASDTSCQGATFTIPVTVSQQSNAS